MISNINWLYEIQFCKVGYSFHNVFCRFILSMNQFLFSLTDNAESG